MSVGTSGFIAGVINSLGEHARAHPWEDARRLFINYASSIHKVVFPIVGSEEKT